MILERKLREDDIIYLYNKMIEHKDHLGIFDTDGFEDKEKSQRHPRQKQQHAERQIDPHIPLFVWIEAGGDKQPNLPE